MTVLSKLGHGLVAAVFTVLATSGVAQAMGRHGAEGHGPMGLHGAQGRAAPGFLAGAVLERVNATAEQKAQIRKIMEGARQDMHAQQQAGQALQQQMMAALAQPNLDAAAIESLRRQISAQRDQNSVRMTQAMVAAAQVLTPEQRKQAAEQFAKRRDMMQQHHREREALDKPRS